MDLLAVVKQLVADLLKAELLQGLGRQVHCIYCCPKMMIHFSKSSLSLQ
jgi:hypothetical protein